MSFPLQGDRSDFAVVLSVVVVVVFAVPLAGGSATGNGGGGGDTDAPSAASAGAKETGGWGHRGWSSTASMGGAGTATRQSRVLVR